VSVPEVQRPEKRRPVIRVVGAAIVDGGRCLLAQRGPGMSQPGLWEFPGGKVEPGEGPRSALEREIREELGLEIEVGEALGRGSADDGERRIELEVYLATATGGELRLAEHERCGWFCAEELADLSWPEADLPIVPVLERVLSASG